MALGTENRDSSHGQLLQTKTAPCNAHFGWEYALQKDFSSMALIREFDGGGVDSRLHSPTLHLAVY